MTDAERLARRSPAEVERDISQTRFELALTLDAIERRLNPRDLIKKGFDMFEDSLIGRKAVDRSVAAVRSHPVPFALLGIGAAWLLASSARAGTDATGEASGYTDGVDRSVGALAADTTGRIGVGPVTSGRDQPLGYTGNPVVDDAGRRQTNGWVHQVTGLAHGALRTVQDAGDAAMNRARGYAGDGTGGFANGLNAVFQRHPLLIGSIAVMGGALIASLLPLSRVEHEWVGGRRDDLWQRTEEFGKEAVSSIREAVSRATTRAADMRNETIKPKEIGDLASH
jgi:hypothetical protein